MMQSTKLWFARRIPFFPLQRLLADSVDLEKWSNPVQFVAPLGIRYEVDLSHAIGKQLFRYGNYEQNCARWVRKLVKPGMTCIDAGANIGNYTLLAAQLVGPSGQVHAFEPAKRTFDLLNRNVAINPKLASRIVTNPFALSDQQSKATLYQNAVGDLTPSLIKTYNSGAREEPVSTTTLDSYVEQKNLKEVHFIKLDIEGAEAAALRGAHKLLGQSSLTYIMCELNEAALQAASSSAKDIVERLKGFGFALFWPRAFPRPMTPLDKAPENVMDNFFFVRQRRT